MFVVRCQCGVTCAFGDQWVFKIKEIFESFEAVIVIGGGTLG
jgi:hypothetical protein